MVRIGNDGMPKLPPISLKNMELYKWRELKIPNTPIIGELKIKKGKKEKKKQ